jgi:hypothetical protein
MKTALAAEALAVETWLVYVGIRSNTISRPWFPFSWFLKVVKDGNGGEMVNGKTKGKEFWSS